MGVNSNSVVNTDATNLRWGPIGLALGSSRLNAATFMFVSFITIGFMIFINIGNTYPVSEQ